MADWNFSEQETVVRRLWEPPFSQSEFQVLGVVLRNHAPCARSSRARCKARRHSYADVRQWR
jgi:hypothetical protein